MGELWGTESTLGIKHRRVVVQRGKQPYERLRVYATTHLV